MHYSGQFDGQADVVVVGYGAAGASTAITAHDEGAEVLIIEKQDEDKRRPNSRFSGGNFINPNSVDDAAHYMSQIYRVNDDLYETDPGVIRAWAEETSHNVAWLEALGGKTLLIAEGGEHPVYEGYRSIDLYKFDLNEHPNGTGQRGWGWGLFKFLSEHVARRGIDVLYGARAQWLLTDAAGAVIGVRVVVGGKERNIRASRGVVLTCGGFEFNDWLKLNYLRVSPTYFYGNPENTGDGIRMAQEVGADLWHMNSCAARLIARFPESGYPGGVPVDIWGLEGTQTILLPDVIRARKGLRLPVAQAEISAEALDLPGVLFTDRYGRRYTNEVYRGHTLYYEVTNLDSHTLQYPKVPSWYFFDEKRRAGQPLTPLYYGPTGPLGQVPWSRDNREEVAKGWIVSSPTIRGLANECGIDPATLEATFRSYNEFCRLGEDPQFGRHPETLVSLDHPPYYAVKLWPGGPNTQGGARRNERAQVMRVTGEPIPGLFSAGEFGSVYGMLYPAGGGNIAECLAFGRVAGRNSARRVV